MPQRSVLVCVALCALSSACGGLDDGFGVAIIATFDSSVSGAQLASVTAFRYLASGDETDKSTSELGRTVNRQERVIYRPRSTTRKLMIEMLAVDENGLVVAEGSTSLLQLSAGQTKETSITLLPPAAFDDMSVVGVDGGDGGTVDNPDGGEGTTSKLSFGTTPVVPTGASPVDIVQADYNGDGRPDVAVAAKVAGLVQVFFTRADGTFPSTPSFQSPVAAAPVALAAGDFDGDTKPDLAVLDAKTGAVTILIGDGAGGLKAGTPRVVAAGLDSMTLGDFDHDTIPDLAFGSSTTAGVWFLYSDDAHTTFKVATGAPVTRLHAADLDGDTFADIVACIPSMNVLQLLINQQKTMALSFAPPGASTTLTADGVVEVVPFDWDGDGAIDLYSFTPSASGGNVTAWTNQGALSFTSTVTIGPDSGSTEYHSIVADLDGDELPDLISAAGDTTGAGSQQAVIAPGKGNVPPQYNKVVVFYGSENGMGALVAADFDGDGLNDVAFVNEVSNTLALAIGNGKGQLRAARAFANATRPRLCDFNADGIEDVCILSIGGGLDLLKGDKMGGLQNGLFIGFNSATQSIVTDLNGDKIPDVVMSGSTGLVLTALGNSAGQFPTTMQTTTMYGTSFSDVGAADFDGDGNMDIVLVDGTSTADTAGKNIVVLPGDGHGGYGTPIYRAAKNAVAFVVVDVNGDKRKDVVVVGSLSQLYTLLSNATGLGTGNVSSASSGNPTGIVSLDANHDGQVDLAVSGDTTHILWGGGDGTFVDHGAVYKVQTNGVTAGDMDGDGQDDLVVMTDHSFIVLPGAVANNGTPLEFAGGANLISVLAGDLTGDGLPEMLTIGRRAYLMLNTTK